MIAKISAVFISAVLCTIVSFSSGTGIIEELFLKEFCNRSRFSVTNDPAVDIDDADNLSGGSGQKEFIGLHKEVYAFVAVIFFIFCYAMSYASRRLEQTLGVGER